MLRTTRGYGFRTRKRPSQLMHTGGMVSYLLDIAWAGLVVLAFTGVVMLIQKWRYR